MQIKTIFTKNNVISTKPKHGPIITGILLSALNPFFIIWWLTIGFKLISDAMLVWAFAGILIVFVLHIWMDFAWLGIVAFLASKSVKIISNRNYKIILLGLSVILIYFGITFLTDIF
jgi:threonine/homoserine/homoserine lactone efflux protein